MNEFINVLQNFGVPVACMVALGWFSYNLNNKVISLVEKVTSAMIENSNNMLTLSNTIDKFLNYIKEEQGNDK